MATFGSVPAPAAMLGAARGGEVEAAVAGMLARLWVLLSATSGEPGQEVAAERPRPAGQPAYQGGVATQPGGQDKDQQRIESLVALAKGGDGEAFGLLYRAYVDVVFRYVLVRVGDRALAEDLTAETFVRALRRISTFTWQGKDIAAWFVTIARNLVVDNARSARFRLEVSIPNPGEVDPRVAGGPDAEVLRRLRDARLLAAVRALKPEQAECVVLRFLQGLSLAETALVLGRSEGAVKQLQIRAVQSLRRQLGDEPP